MRIARPEMASPHTRGWTPARGRRWSSAAGFPAHAGMDLRDAYAQGATQRLPRTRGDGPEIQLVFVIPALASPHTRGWTRGCPVQCRARGGFPAHAGMDPGHSTYPGPTQRLPRTRGDGPPAPPPCDARPKASPHTRGWTLVPQQRRHRAGGFPAHAGMDPVDLIERVRSTRLPRTRGDGPQPSSTRSCWRVASPHTRGWTRVLRLDLQRHVGFPAHAGMDPGCSPAATPSSWLPRTRGDGP